MFSSEQYEAIGQLIPLINQHAGRFALLRTDWWEAPQKKCQEYLTEHFAALPQRLGEALENARRLGVQEMFAITLDHLDRASGSEDSLTSTYRVFRTLEVTSDLCLNQLGAPLVKTDLTLACLILNTFCGESVALQIDEEIEAVANAIFLNQQPRQQSFHNLLQRLNSGTGQITAKPAMVCSFS